MLWAGLSAACRLSPCDTSK